MTTRFLADENAPASMVDALRAAGHDVDWVLERAPGLADREVLAMAERDRRILLSFDKDFGELTRRNSLNGDCGVVLLRLRKPATVEAAQALVAVLASRDDWAGHVSVVEAGRVRRRALPAR